MCIPPGARRDPRLVGERGGQRRGDRVDVVGAVDHRRPADRDLWGLGRVHGRRDGADRERAGNTQQVSSTPEEEVGSDAEEEKEETDPKEEANDDANNDTEEIVDVCLKIGLKGGERLEVEWQLEEPSPEENGEPKTVNKWWGCKLLPHDGRTVDGVAVRVLDYDPYPEGGFMERSLEEVIFLSHDICISPESHAEFRFRPEGVVQFSNEEETREAINGILMSTLDKHAGMWKSLDRAQQARIADGIAQKKEQLVEAIMTHSKSSVIGGDDMKEILQGIMQRR